MVVVPLKIVAPIDINGQPVTLGVPFPRGVLRDPATLRLFDEAGEPVLLQTATLARWVDGSIKWVQVDFILKRVTRGSHTWQLSDREKNLGRTSPTLLSATESGEYGFVIETGTGELTLTRCTTLEEVDEKRLADAQAGQLKFTLGTALGETKGEGFEFPWPLLTYRLSHSRYELVDPTFHLADSEETGPVTATIRHWGWFSGWTYSTYLGRITFFAGTNLVRVRLTYHNPLPAKHKGGLWDLGDGNSDCFEGLHLRFNLPKIEDVQWKANFTENVFHSKPPWSIHQLSSGGDEWRSRNHVNADGRAYLAECGYQVKPEGVNRQDDRAYPIVAVRGEGGFMTLAMPEFWQQFPKRIECDSDGVTLSLFPLSTHNPHEMQGGEQKTHTVWFQFSSRSEPPPSLDWVHQPALVQVAPEWIEQSGVLPFFPNSLDPGGAGERFATLMRDAVEGPDSFFAKRERIDEYGWRHYGELYADHENEHYPGRKPVVSHYNNQYDALNGLLMQYLRTGDPRWWQLADPLARHVYDIDIYHTDQDRPAYNGGMFWHTDHYKDAATATHRAYSKANKPPGKPYGGGPGNEHNWSTGLLNYYYLAGDPLAREAVLSLANWVIDRDDGSKTFLGLIDDGPTGLSSRTGGDGSYHGPGRGGGNSINSLLDGWLLTDERRYLDKAEELIRRCIHPIDDLDALDMGNPEERWSYTVFLSVIARYLELKRQADQVDERYAYARASLLHYARWMVAHEKPYFDQVERLEFPNETWAAQEMRKANVLRLAARYAEEPDRSAMLRRGTELADRAWHDIYRFESRTSTRSLAILMTEGLRDSYLRTHSEERVTETGRATDFGSPMNFVPQRTRVKRQLKSVRGWLRAMPRLLNPLRWLRAMGTRQWW